MKTPHTLFAAILILFLLNHCSSARRGTPVHPPLNIISPAVAEGEAVFMTHCHKCHPGGEAGLGPAINNKPLPGFLMKLQVRKGIGMMPAFKKDRISEDELDNLIKYMKALRAAK